MPIYRGTYVIERVPEEEDGTPEVLFSVSSELPGPSVSEAHDPLLLKVSEKIERLRPLLATAEEEPDALPVEHVPNAPTLRSVNPEEK
jgi:hypothetical protein